MQKFLKEVTLLGQPFVKDDKQTVEQLLKGERCTGSELRLCTWWARASRRSRATLPPKSMAQAAAGSRTSERPADAPDRRHVA